MRDSRGDNCDIAILSTAAAGGSAGSAGGAAGGSAGSANAAGVARTAGAAETAFLIGDRRTFIASNATAAEPVHQKHS